MGVRMYAETITLYWLLVFAVRRGDRSVRSLSVTFSLGVFSSKLPTATDRCLGAVRFECLPYGATRPPLGMQDGA